MAVPVATGSTQPSFGSPEVLFDFRTATILPQANMLQYAPSSDGQRFLVQKLETEVRPALDVLVNWQRQPATR